MKITFDPWKHRKTLEARGLDFLRAGEIIEGPQFTIADHRQNYGEDRFITVGLLDARMVVMVWTPRDGGCRVISLRKANEREQEKYAEIFR